MVHVTVVQFCVAVPALFLHRFSCFRKVALSLLPPKDNLGGPNNIFLFQSDIFLMFTVSTCHFCSLWNNNRLVL